MAMEITSDTRIKELLKDNREMVIDALVKFNSNFSKLRNPVLRSLMGRRVTIADACNVAGCTLQDFMSVMRSLGFVIGEGTAAELREGRVGQINAHNYVELDVRPILAANKDPLKTILSAINNLKANEGLKLINSFEPVPLINLLREKGFDYTIVKPDPHTVITYFNRADSVLQAKIDLPEVKVSADMESFDRMLMQFPAEEIKYIDVRNLEMPTPMVTILESLGELKKGGALFVYHKKRPVFLLPELEKRGYKYLFKDMAEGNVNILIY